MRLAIVGSRDYPNLVEVNQFVGLLPREFVVVSGGAKGVDSEAASAGRGYGLKVVEYLITDELKEQFGGAAAFKRNELIVENCDKLVAFWNPPSRGTAHAIRIAMMYGKLQKIMTPWATLRPGESSGATPPPVAPDAGGASDVRPSGTFSVDRQVATEELERAASHILEAHLALKEMGDDWKRGRALPESELMDMREALSECSDSLSEIIGGAEPLEPVGKLFGKLLDFHIEMDRRLRALEGR